MSNGDTPVVVLSSVPEASFTSGSSSDPPSRSLIMENRSEFFASMTYPSAPQSMLSHSQSVPSWPVSSMPAQEGRAVSVPRVVSALSAVNTSEERSTASPTYHPSSGSLSSLNTASRSPGASSTKRTVTRKASNAKSQKGASSNTNRRQKRLERNRESARLSRRRRKQYLEVLEERVTQLSHELDSGRRAHVAQAIQTIYYKRREILENPDHAPSVEGLAPLNSALARTSSELMIVNTFQSQQLRSFILPPHIKFINWLTLQTDTYFRGGRAASERLSAARIGERMLSSGTDKVTPAQSMWPLFCNEVGVSYEQEERVRNFQRALLLNSDVWVDRHTAYAARKVMESAHDAVQAVTLRLGQRERSGLGILSDEQRIKFLAWSARNRDRVDHIRARKFTGDAATKQAEQEKFQTSDKHHVAANLYILNNRLQMLLQKVPRAAPLVTGLALKKLSRRPSFESLGSVNVDDKKKDGDLSRENSFASSGSLKRSASEISMEGSSDEQRPHVPSISPVEAEATALPFVKKFIGFIEEIIPSPPTPTLWVPAPAPVQPRATEKAQTSSTQVQASPQHTTVSALQQPPQYQYQYVEAGQYQLSQAPVPVDQPSKQSSHVRQSSFLPTHLNVVPEEMWPTDNADGEDFLMSLVDSDWAIGEGIDMEY